MADKIASHFPRKKPQGNKPMFPPESEVALMFLKSYTGLSDDRLVEKLVHKTIDRLTDLRIRQNREFFNVAPQIALDIFKDIAQTIDDAIVTEYRDNKPFKQYSMNDEDNDNTHDEEGETIPSPEPPKPPKKGRFKFSMVGIKVGEILTFIPTGIKVKVSGDDSIEYEGRIYKLSPFVGTFMPEDKRNESGAYQGAKYFLYNGKILNDIRQEMEREGHGILEK